MNYSDESLQQHSLHHGKWEMLSKFPVTNKDELSIAYTPGIGAVSSELFVHPERVNELTMKGNTVAVVSDGTAVLGLGNIGPLAALPVMEGKAILFKQFAGVDAVPLVLSTQNPEEIIATVRAIAPTFGGINLEDIAAPNCFIVEDALQDLGIPVFHDDQHGTAIVVLASLINAARVAKKEMSELKVVVNGSGAAGIAITKLLGCVGQQADVCTPVKNILVCDSKGIISSRRDDLNAYKKQLLLFTNHNNKEGSLQDALAGADCFIGVSKGNILNKEDISMMAKDPIIFALANPIPEIMPEEAKEGGALIVGTGRSDFPNQINNVLVFPGIFKGALEARAPRITAEMKIAAAYALAGMVAEPDAENLLPNPFNPDVANVIADAVKNVQKK